MSYDPTPAFHFRVTFGGQSNLDTSFQQVSGIGAKVEIEKVPEGGQDDRILPIRSTYQNLVLKRGIAGLDSELVKWCDIWMSAWRTGAVVTTKDVVVSLLDKDQNPLHAWSFAQAYPVEWGLGALDAQKNEVAIETIELTYQYWERVQ